MKKTLIILFSFSLLFSLIGLANAALIDLGGGLIYDDVLDIMWLQDANYAAGSGYDDGSDTTDGLMTWDNAVAWADQLEYQGYTDWRLPTTVDEPYVYGYDGTNTYGYNVTSSEMGYMFYVNLGNLARFDTDGNLIESGWGLTNTGPFTNLQDGCYWSGTEFDSNPDHAWFINFHNGYQGTYGKNTNFFYAWAVCDGDSSPIPIPSAVWLLGSGIIGIVGIRRKFNK